MCTRGFDNWKWVCGETGERLGAVEGGSRWAWVDPVYKVNPYAKKKKGGGSPETLGRCCTSLANMIGTAGGKNAQFV